MKNIGFIIIICGLVLLLALSFIFRRDYEPAGNNSLVPNKPLDSIRIVNNNHRDTVILKITKVKTVLKYKKEKQDTLSSDSLTKSINQILNY